jgi:cytochrome c oxidase subunit II
MSRRSLRGVAFCLLVAGLAGCGDNGQSTLSPKSRPADAITSLWWAMLAIGTVVFVGALGLLALSWLRRHREGLPIVGGSERASSALVVAFGIAIPAVVLVALWAVADLVVIKQTEAPARGSTSMTVVVTGHQWFWEARYPGTTAVTADEIHIPARTRVNVELKTADVMHSFWVPELNRKADTLPGHPNRLLLYSDKPGRFGGQCAEFCGLQHANMRDVVVVDTPARFRAWLHDEAAPRRAPSTPEQAAGEKVFLSQSCAGCHAIRGTSARGRIGPDLTHLARRRSLAALTIPNTRAGLREWIADPQHVKPGNKMPGLHLSEPQLRALVDYLESLR